MLQTIEVEIDPSGHIHPLEPLTFIPAGRAYLTLLPAQNKELRTSIAGDSKVGWVERSDTHHFVRIIRRWVSLRSTHPTRANDDRLNTVAEKMAVNVLSRAAP